MKDIGYWTPYAINNLAQVVGMSGGRAVLWQNQVLYDLNDLVPPDTPLLLYAMAINDAGQILCRYHQVYTRACLLTPIGAALAGTVRDELTGEPIVGAGVSVPGLSPTQTGAQGEFTFSGLPAGQTTVTASKAGYHDASQAVILNVNSWTFVSLLMMPDRDFEVVEVRGRYCGPGRRTYYLDDSTLFETLTAKIDWNEQTPGLIRWITPSAAYEDPCSGDSGTRTFDMGGDFEPGGTLTVVAVTGDSPPAESDPYIANFKVISSPIGIATSFLYAYPLGNTLKYVTPSVAGNENLSVVAGAPQGTIPTSMPLFGGEALEFGALFKVGAEVNGDGTGSGTFLNIEGSASHSRIAGFAFAPHVSGSATWHFYEDPDQWVAGGRVEFGGAFGADVPPAPVYFPLGACPLCVPAYFRGHIDIGLAVGLDLTSWAAPGEPVWSGTLDLDPFPYAEAMLGVGAADMLAVEGYFGGGARTQLQYPQEPTIVSLQMYLAGGARVVLLVFTIDYPLLEYTWDVYEGGRQQSDFELPTIRLMPRDYLNPSEKYSVFVANDDVRSGQRDVVTEETPIQLNVFGQSTPDMVAIGNDLLTVWIYDDPARTPTNRTEVVFSAYDSTTETWSTPMAAADDGTADFHPQLAALANGDVLLAWENVGEVLDEPVDPNDPDQVQAKLEEMKSKTEIAVAMYDATARTWSAQIVMTDNEFLDRSPRLAAAADGTAMLTWISNVANHEMGTSSAPNDIHYVAYDGSTWSAPADVALGVPSVVKSAMAYDGTNAVLVFVGDTDDNTQTPEDRELFAVTYDGSGWGTVAQLTADVVEDASPQAAYDSNGELFLVWYGDGDIVMATDLSLADEQTIVDQQGEASSGAADFRVASGDGGQISLVWQDASDDLVDMWYASYDPAVSIWSKPQRLTSDESMEHAMAPVFDGSGDLVVAYDKVQIVRETRTVIVGGDEIQIDNVPVPSQTDLYVLRHVVSGDLTVDSADVTVSPENPLAGMLAAVKARVRNLGDVPATSVTVAFYDGDPNNAGTLIDTATISGPLVGGDEAEVNVGWLVPASTAPHDVYVVVDPSLEQEDRDRNNNTAVLAGVMKPDVAITEIGAQTAGPNHIITVRVANDGALDVTMVNVALRKDAVDGELLTSFSIADPIVPGAYRDVSWVWEDAGPFPGGSAEVFAVADEANEIDEFDEDNNVRWALARNIRSINPGDWDGDGDVDLSDYAEFPGCISGPWQAPSFVMPSQGCLDAFDFDADADVDLQDFAGFQVLFTGSSA